ncbi:MAG: hypothetical protein MI866_22200 [Bacteroidales bacterium]|nr:hypothetical protein [Bacteroidales bacterium]
MQSHLTKLFILFFVLPILSCDPNSYITKKQHFKDEYTLLKVEAPKYTFPNNQHKNLISISFPKQNEFNLQLSNTSCGGKYEATTDGDIKFYRTNCYTSCCETKWDEYVLTLLKNVSSYDDSESNKLMLFINDNNYLILESNSKPAISSR